MASSAISCTEIVFRTPFQSIIWLASSMSMRRLRQDARIRRFCLGLEKLGHFYIDESIPAYD